MSLFGSIKDHVMIGGPNAVAGWGLFTLLVLSRGFYAGRFIPIIDLNLFLVVLAAAALMGNGIYALNAYRDREAGKVNKPNRPISSGRMTPSHALKYSIVLIASGLAMSGVASILSGSYMTLLVWSLLTGLGIAYSIPPFKLKSRHILGNLCVGAFAMLLILTIGNILGIAAPININTLWITNFVLYIVYIAGLITIKDFQDVEGDKKNGDITLPVKFGRKKSALLSIGLFTIPTIVSSLTLPSSTIIGWIVTNFSFLTFVGIFAAYIALDYAGRNHAISDTFSRVTYYYLIITVVYTFLKTAFFPTNILSLVVRYDLYVPLVAFVIVATAIVLRSHKTGHDILKPTQF